MSSSVRPHKISFCAAQCRGADGGAGAFDGSVLQFAYELGCVLLTCKRDRFLRLATMRAHHGIVIVIRRRTRADERAALFGLLERTGETGLRNNVNFA